jgi:hypothetical protein
MNELQDRFGWVSFNDAVEHTVNDQESWIFLGERV